MRVVISVLFTAFSPVATFGTQKLLGFIFGINEGMHTSKWVYMKTQIRWVNTWKLKLGKIKNQYDFYKCWEPRGHSHSKSNFYCHGEKGNLSFKVLLFIEIFFLDWSFLNFPNVCEDIKFVSLINYSVCLGVI